MWGWIWSLTRSRVRLLLELNARPGLAIQIANRDGLYGRLKKIDQAPREIFASLDARMAWTMETFGASEVW